MSRLDKMQLFREALRERVPRIERATYSDLTFLTGEHGEFTLVAKWTATKTLPAGEYKILFSRQRVLGRTANMPPRLQRLEKKTCRMADEIIREIQRARGV